MKVSPSKRAVAWNAVFRLLIGLGILTSLLGIGMDIIPGSAPGFNLPQLLLTAAGLALVLVAFAWRSAVVRGGGGTKYWARILAIAAMTLIALELALVAADIPTYFPPPMDDVPHPFYQPAPWWTCDEAGCHYVQEYIDAACESGQLAFDRECLVNQQGFHDSQDFVAGDALMSGLRILMLGDSFTFGLAADIGKSYVETIEANLPQSIVWNTGIFATGTKQALASFQVYAPILQPQLTILGFVMNDFINNMLPVDHRILGIDWKNEPFRIKRYDIDEHSGNVIKLGYEALYYRRYNYAYPPDSELERLIGRTRLGSLLPRFFKARMWADKDEIFHGSLISQSVDSTREYLKALRDAAAAQDTALLILVIQSRVDFTGFTPYYQAALRLFEELEIAYLDTSPLLDIRDYGGRFPDGPHWNTVGHQKVGNMLTDCLASFQISGDLSDCEQVEMPSAGMR